MIHVGNLDGHIELRKLAAARLPVDALLWHGAGSGQFCKSFQFHRGDRNPIDNNPIDKNPINKSRTPCGPLLHYFHGSGLERTEQLRLICLVSLKAQRKRIVIKATTRARLRSDVRQLYRSFELHSMPAEDLEGRENMGRTLQAVEYEEMAMRQVLAGRLKCSLCNEAWGLAVL